MKNFLELTDTNHTLNNTITVRPYYDKSAPSVIIQHDDFVLYTGTLPEVRSFTFNCNLRDLYSINVSLTYKDEDSEPESAVIVEQFIVDDIPLLPKYMLHSEYDASDDPTTHLDKLGTWCMKFDQPFYQWYHNVSGQGWLFYQNQS